MRRMILAAAAMAAGAACASSATAQEHQHAGGISAMAMADHQRTFHMARIEADVAELDGDPLFTWDGEAWIGGDRNKLWLKSEGEVHDSEVEQAEVQALYSRQVSTFWDVQVGARHDFEPSSTTYLALGVQGLSPYQFETEATAFVSEDGDPSFRLKHSLDLLFTQKVVLEPSIELNLQGRDVPELGVKSGFTDLEIAAQLRYEVTKKFAPYVEVAYERLLGDTGDAARAAGKDRDNTLVRLGLRTWF